MVTIALPKKVTSSGVSVRATKFAEKELLRVKTDDFHTVTQGLLLREVHARFRQTFGQHPNPHEIRVRSQFIHLLDMFAPSIVGKRSLSSNEGLRDDIAMSRGLRRVVVLPDVVEVLY